MSSSIRAPACHWERVGKGNEVHLAICGIGKSPPHKNVVNMWNAESRKAKLDDS